MSASDSDKFGALQQRTHLVSIDSSARVVHQTNGSTANFTYALLRPINNVRRLRLRSVKMPSEVLQYDATDRKNTSFRAFYYLSGAEHQADITVPDGVYSSVSALVTAINTAASGTGFTFTYDSTTRLVTVSHTNPGFSIYWNLNWPDRTSNWGLGWDLGFRNTKDLAVSGSSLVGTARALVRDDPFLLLQINELPVVEHQLQDNSQVLAFARLEYSTGEYTSYGPPDNALPYEWTYPTGPTKLSQITVRFVDRFGDAVNFQGRDVSLLLEATEVTNSHDAEAQRTYLLASGAAVPSPQVFPTRRAPVVGGYDMPSVMDSHAPAYFRR